MARGSKAANTAATAAQGFGNQQNANSQALFSTLAPQLESEAANPQGFAPSDLAAMNTAAQESAGGSEAAAVGQGALKAARTGNVGGSDAAIGEGVRDAGRNLSRAALGTQIMNAREKESNRQAGLRGLESLTGLETGSVVPAFNAVSNAVNANTNAENQSWDWAKYILDPAMAGAAGGLGAAFSH